MKGFVKTVSIFLFFISTLNDISAQTTTTTSCVNYDSRYPITTSTGRKYFWNPIWNFPTLKEKKVSNLVIGTRGLWKGLLEFLPAGYTLAANASKKYPVIIYFHGGASMGDGSSLQLCRLFKDRGGDSVTFKAVPGRVERNTNLFTQAFNGISYSYIVISPQFTQYTRLVSGKPDYFPSAKDVEDVINYVQAHYRIDTRKIYLTGFSNGANMIIEYAGSSVARAKRVAAIMPVSLCSQLGHISNTSNGIFAKNIGLAKLKTWFVYCEADNCGSGPVMNVSNAWVDSIKKVPGSYPPRYTRLRNINPPTLYNCSDTLLHDAWSRAYDPVFRVSYNYTPSLPLVNDGINLNMYEWFIRQVSPVASPAPASMTLEPEKQMPLNESHVVVSPNPFNGQLTAYISLNKPGRLVLTLTDLTGKMIQSVNGVYGPGTSQVRFSSVNLPSGVYLLKINGDGLNSVQKVISK